MGRGPKVNYKRWHVHMRCPQCKRYGFVTVDYPRPVPRPRPDEVPPQPCTSCGGVALRLVPSKMPAPTSKESRAKPPFGARPPSRDKQAKQPDFVGIDALDASLADHGVNVASLDAADDDEQDDDGLYAPAERFTGYPMRLNTVDYAGAIPGNPPAGYDQRHTIVNAQLVGSGGRDPQGQQRTMGLHFSANLPHPTTGAAPAKPKAWVASVMVGTPGSASARVRATDFANVYLANDAQLNGVFDGRDRHHRMEWCHGLACSLGGANTYENLFAASYDANTFSMVIESWLSAQRATRSVYTWIRLHYQGKQGASVAVADPRTSSRRAPGVIEYVIATNQHGQRACTFYIDARCVGFARTDADRVLQLLGSHAF
jgi:hypothetical protein